MLLGFIHLSPISVKPVKIDTILITKLSIKPVKKKEYDYLFISIINNTKSHEGFSHTPYLDINKHPTIGFGFLLEYIPKKYHDYISKEASHELLIKKMTRCIVYAKKTYPGYSYKQYLAISHLAYGKGFLTIQKHQLHNQLKAHTVDSLTWLYFSNYEKTRENYKNSRLFELNLFFSH